VGGAVVASVGRASVAGVGVAGVGVAGVGVAGVGVGEARRIRDWRYWYDSRAIQNGPV
jgi:hypothetical protein